MTDRKVLVAGLDCAPTVFDLMGIAVPGTMKGRVLRPATKG